MMKNVNLVEIDYSIYSRLIKERSELQIWPCYYRIRKTNLEILLKILKLKKVDRLLEIGCGLSYASMLLANNFKEVYAFDLLDFDEYSHSIGINHANAIGKEVNIKNVYLAAANAAEIPFKTNSIDLVISLYTLEHIPLQLRNEVLIETRRVMKKDAYAVFVLPNFMERIYNLPRFYFYLGRRIFNRLFSDNDKHPKVNLEGEKKKSKVNWKKVIIPSPHGLYRNSFEEFYNHLPEKWIDLFRKNNFKIAKIFTTEWTVPWQDEFTVLFYEKTKDISIKTGDNSFFKYLGHSIGFLIKK